jgi:hypothetical protein
VVDANVIARRSKRWLARPAQCAHHSLSSQIVSKRNACRPVVAMGLLRSGEIVLRRIDGRRTMPKRKTQLKAA